MSVVFGQPANAARTGVARMKDRQLTKRLIIAATLVFVAIFSVACASSGPTDKPLPAIKQTSGPYRLTECGSIVDSATNLEWLVGPDELQTREAAEAWLDSLRRCDGPCCDKHWRLPELREVQALRRPFVRDGQQTNLLDQQFRELAGGEHWSLWDKTAHRRDSNPNGAAVGFGVGIVQPGAGGGVAAVIPVPPAGPEERRRPVAVRSR